MEGKIILLILLLTILAVIPSVLANNENGYLPEDLNKDGKVDIKDVAELAKAFGSYPGHTRWNPDADLDGNEIVNIFDVAIVAKDFGKTT